jgi:hypothetical protein
MDLYALMMALGLFLLALSFVLTNGHARIAAVSLSAAMFAVAVLRTVNVI